MESPSVLTVSAETRQLARVRRFVAARAGELGLAEAAVSDLVLAVDEAVTNAIQHGYHGTAGEVEVRVSEGHGGIVVRVVDNAPSFDPTSVPAPDPSIPVKDRPVGGVGLVLVRKLVDRITHQAGPRGGNELILVKKVERRAGV